MSRTVVLQQECEAGISPQSPAILRQHSRSSEVRLFSGCKQAISGDAKIESANSKAASLQSDRTRRYCIFSVVFTAITSVIASVLEMAQSVTRGGEIVPELHSPACNHRFIRQFRRQFLGPNLRAFLAAFAMISWFFWIS